MVNPESMENQIYFKIQSFENSLRLIYFNALASSMAVRLKTKISFVSRRSHIGTKCQGREITSLGELDKTSEQSTHEDPYS